MRNLSTLIGLSLFDEISGTGCDEKDICFDSIVVDDGVQDMFIRFDCCR